MLLKWQKPRMKLNPLSRMGPIENVFLRSIACAQEWHECDFHNSQCFLPPDKHPRPFTHLSVTHKCLACALAAGCLLLAHSTAAQVPYLCSMFMHLLQHFKSHSCAGMPEWRTMPTTDALPVGSLHWCACGCTAWRHVLGHLSTFCRSLDRMCRLCGRPATIPGRRSQRRMSQ